MLKKNFFYRKKNWNKDKKDQVSMPPCMMSDTFHMFFPGKFAYRWLYHQKIWALLAPIQVPKQMAMNIKKKELIEMNNLLL